MPFVTSKNAHCLAKAVAFLAFITLLADTAYTEILHNISDKSGRRFFRIIDPDSEIFTLRPVADACAFVLFLLLLLKKRHVSEKRRRNTMASIRLAVVIFWLVPNCILVDRLYILVQMETDSVGLNVFRCEIDPTDHCGLKNFTNLFGMAGALLGLVETYISYKAENDPLPMMMEGKIDQDEEENIENIILSPSAARVHNSVSSTSSLTNALPAVHVNTNPDKAITHSQIAFRH